MNINHEHPSRCKWKEVSKQPTIFNLGPSCAQLEERPRKRHKANVMAAQAKANSASGSGTGGPKAFTRRTALREIEDWAQKLWEEEKVFQSSCPEEEGAVSFVV